MRKDDGGSGKKRVRNGFECRLHKASGRSGPAHDNIGFILLELIVSIFLSLLILLFQLETLLFINVHGTETARFARRRYYNDVRRVRTIRTSFVEIKGGKPMKTVNHGKSS